MLRIVFSLLAALMLLGFGDFSRLGQAIQEMNQAPEITSLTQVSTKRKASGATFEVRWSVANEGLPRSGGCLGWRPTPSGSILEDRVEGSECFDGTALSRRFSTWGGLAGQYQVRVQQKYLAGGQTYTSQWSNWSSVNVYR